MSPGMTGFVHGGVAALAWVAGVHFLRFWRRTQDRFFLLFGVSFWVMAVNRALLTWLGNDAGVAVYVVRLAAYLLLLYAIVDKNVRR